MSGLLQQVGLWPAAHHPVHDQGQETNKSICPDALGQPVVVHRRNLYLRLEHLKALLNVGQRLVALHHLCGFQVVDARRKDDPLVVANLKLAPYESRTYAIWRRTRGLKPLVKIQSAQVVNIGSAPTPRWPGLFLTAPARRPLRPAPCPF